MKTVIERPEPSSKHPIVVFTMGLCLVSGLAITGGNSEPSSIEATLPPLGVWLWGVCLVFGASLILGGLLLQAADQRLLLGVLFEFVGMAAMGVAAILYAAAVIVVVGSDALFPVSITLGFGVSCLYRTGTLYRGLKRAERKVKERRVSADGER